MKDIEYKPTNYPSDLSDVQWEKIAEFFPMGNKGEIHKRSLVEAVLHTKACWEKHATGMFCNPPGGQRLQVARAAA